MKKISLLLAVLMVGSCTLTACDRGSNTIKTDATKSQLYVGVYDGGFGCKFVETWGNKFEELYKDYSFEEGKVGVEVIPEVSKVYALDNLAYRLNEQVHEIAFIEQCNYYNLIKENAVLDVTEWVKTPLTEYGETESIEDKMQEMDIAYYGQNANDTQYYGIPWYLAMSTISYDVQLFEDNCFYFAAEGAGDDEGFIETIDDTKSNGPDGKAGTSDDGLPATYEEFFTLCDRICAFGMTPMIWAGGVQHYVNYLVTSFVADYEGYDNMKLNYTFDGTVDSLVKSISNGIATLENEMQITQENGYELKKQAGWYYALKFIHRLITTKDEEGKAKYYNYDDCFSESVSHKTVQTKFLRSNYTSSIPSIAMITDGTWWYNEASETFAAMSGTVGASKKDRKIGIMPIPKVSEAQIGEQGTVMQSWVSSVVVRSNIAESKKELVRAFYRFIHTDENLSTYMVDACGIRPYEFELTGVSEKDMPMYTREQYTMFKNTKAVRPYANNPICKQYLSEIHNNYTTLIGNAQYTLVTKAFNEGVSPEAYFNGMAEYMNATAWSRFI